MYSPQPEVQTPAQSGSFASTVNVTIPPGATAGILAEKLSTTGAAARAEEVSIKPKNMAKKQIVDTQRATALTLVPEVRNIPQFNWISSLFFIHLPANRSL
jgi:hypothetical protein